jgi:hypothetical protein
MESLGPEQAEATASSGPGQIIWLASYPKSGNTWIRSLLTAYRQESGPALDINRLTGTIAASRGHLDEILGVPTSELTVAELHRWLPRVYEAWSRLPGAPHFVKTHDALVSMATGASPFPLEATRCAVLCVRDPRDVALSAMHHWGLSLEEAVARLSQSDFWLGRGADPGPHVPQFISDWSTHTLGWLRGPLPVLVVRYEDLKRDAAAQLRRIVERAGLPVNATRLEQAAAACALDKLQEQERAGGFRERLRASTAPFFRSGQVGGWKSEMTATQVQRIVDAHGATMQLLGYLP